MAGQVGGYTAVYFFIATWVICYMAATLHQADITSFLITKLNVKLDKVAEELTHINGASIIMALIALIVLESYVSRFRSIVVAFILSEVGLLILMTFAFVPSLRPPQCSGKCEETSAAILWPVRIAIAIFLVSFGNVLSEACLLGFGADQIFMDTVAYHEYKFSNIYYFSNIFVASSNVAITIFLKNSIKWGPRVSFTISFVLFALCLLLFISRHGSYRKVPPAGSFVLLRLLQVVLGAFKKRDENLPDDSLNLNQDRHERSRHLRLQHTNHLRQSCNYNRLGSSKFARFMEVATVQRNEEVKFFIRLIPIWIVSVMLVGIIEKHSDFSNEQLATMDLSFLGKQAYLFLFIIELLCDLFCLFIIYPFLVVPVACMIMNRPYGLTTYQRIGCGLIIYLVAIIVQALVEIRRISIVAKDGLSMNGCWLIPEYFVIHLGDLFVSVGVSEWLFAKTPKNVRSMGWWLDNTSDVLGRYISKIMVQIVKHVTGRTWIATDINKGRVDYYDWAMVMVLTVVIIFYMVIQRYMRLDISLRSKTSTLTPSASQPHISPSQSSQGTVSQPQISPSQSSEGDVTGVIREDWMGPFLASVGEDMNEESEIGKIENWLGHFLSEYEDPIILISKKATVKDFHQRAYQFCHLTSEQVAVKDYYGKEKPSLDANIPMDHDVLMDSMGCIHENDRSYNDANSIVLGSHKTCYRTTHSEQVGLVNLGTTCNMTNTVQCLVHTPEIARYFHDHYHRDINSEKLLGIKTELPRAFGELQREFWTPSQKAVAPELFLANHSKFGTHFIEHNQHDSQELFAFMLNGPQKDLNLVKQRPYIESKDADDKPDEELVDEYWANHLAHHDSVIVDMCEEVNILINDYDV